MPGKHLTDALQKMAILGTYHTIWKVLQSETGNLSRGDHCWLRMSTRKKRPVTRDDGDDHNKNKNKNNNNNSSKIHERNQANMNSTIKVTAKVAEE